MFVIYYAFGFTRSAAQLIQSNASHLGVVCCLHVMFIVVQNFISEFMFDTRVHFTFLVCIASIYVTFQDVSETEYAEIESVSFVEMPRILVP